MLNKKMINKILKKISNKYISYKKSNQNYLLTILSKKHYITRGYINYLLNIEVRILLK